MIVISSKNKGIIFIIDYAVLFICYVLLFIFKYFDIDIIKTIDSYAFIVCGALFWITGILKLVNNSISSTIKLLEPSD
jgi:succinate-acetate transporter protein